MERNDVEEAAGEVVDADREAAAPGEVASGQETEGDGDQRAERGCQQRLEDRDRHLQDDGAGHFGVKIERDEAADQCPKGGGRLEERAKVNVGQLPAIDESGGDQ